MASDELIIPCPECGTKNRIPGSRRGEKAVCGKCRAPLTVGGPFAAHPVEVTDQTFAREVLQHPGPLVLDCWAPWCGPCRSVAPVLDQLAREYAGRVKIAKLNTDQNQRTSANYSIQSIPTLLFFKDGKLVNRQVGALPKPEMERLIRQIL